MTLAGTYVRDQDLLEFARVLSERCCVEIAEKPEIGYDVETNALPLSIVDRESILRTLDYPQTEGIAALCDVVLCELEGLV